MNAAQKLGTLWIRFAKSDGKQCKAGIYYAGWLEIYGYFLPEIGLNSENLSYGLDFLSLPNMRS